MRNILIGLSFLLLNSSLAFANSEESIQAKCEAAMKETDTDNVEEGCICFTNSLSKEEKEEYLTLDLTTWNEDASVSLKNAGTRCFQ